MRLSSSSSTNHALRMLGQSSAALRRSFSRLSSGSRLTHPGDDPAGLAIASSLRVDTRVYSQAVRNLNDAISAVSIADGALTEMSAIVARQRELAQQSANGTLSAAQRGALNTEAQRLLDEYNRISQTTTFNGLRLLDPSLSLSAQSGYGAAANIAISMGAALSGSSGSSSTTGDGTFVSSTAFSYPADMASTGITIGDVNGDGHQDLIAAENYDDGYYTAHSYTIMLGNGDGTFQPEARNYLGNLLYSIASADFNADGRSDVVLGGGSDAFVFTGQPNGTITYKQTLDTTSEGRETATGDFNKDGRQDVVIATWEGPNLFFGNGDGSFGARQLIAAPTAVYDMIVGDLNSDGNLDVMVSGDKLSVHYGLGNGTFQAQVSYDAGFDAFGTAVADFNGDGRNDILAAGPSGAGAILYANAGGGFNAPVALTFGATAYEPVAADFNGDGRIDFAVGANRVEVHLNNGNGTFARTNYVMAWPWDLKLGDFNEDGAADMMMVSNGAVSKMLAQTGTTTTAGPGPLTIDLSTAASSKQAMSALEQASRNISTEMGSIGAFLSRLTTTRSNVLAAHEMNSQAESRIGDVDVASETSQLVKGRLLQNSAVAMLAHARSGDQTILELLNAL